MCGFRDVLFTTAHASHLKDGEVGGVVMEVLDRGEKALCVSPRRLGLEPGSGSGRAAVWLKWVVIWWGANHITELWQEMALRWGGVGGGLLSASLIQLSDVCSFICVETTLVCETV